MFYQKYLAIFINLFSFFGFITLIFYPTNFRIYFAVFYVYGVGNLLDRGNILGAMCIFVSILFFNRLGYFKKHKAIKIALLSILPTFALFTQIWTEEPVFFVISFFHICGLGVMIVVLYIFFYHQLSSIQNVHTSMALSPDICTEDELDWLTMMSRGEKYISISKKYNVSESKVKQRMLELYKILDVRDKTEFLTVYHGCEFTHKKSDS